MLNPMQVYRATQNLPTDIERWIQGTIDAEGNVLDGQEDFDAQRLSEGVYLVTLKRPYTSRFLPTHGGVTLELNPFQAAANCYYCHYQSGDFPFGRSVGAEFGDFGGDVVEGTKAWFKYFTFEITERGYLMRDMPVSFLALGFDKAPTPPTSAYYPPN